MTIRRPDVPIRILLVEDQDDDAMFLTNALQQCEFEFDCQRVSNADEYVQALAITPDVILGDDGTAGLDALQALSHLQERGISAPLIVLTGLVDERAAVECLKHGAADYLSKDRLTRLGPAILRVIADRNSELEHRRTVAALRESEERSRFIAEASGDALYRLRFDQMRYDYISPAIEGLTGYTVDEINELGFKNIVEKIVSMRDQDLSPSCLIAARVAGNVEAFRAVYLIRTKSGDERWLADHSQPWRDQTGNAIGSAGLLTDVTERRQLEEQLRQSQKMEVIGQLAGGVAHDFNNLLTVIVGFGEMLSDELPADSPYREPVELILAAGESAAALTRQLLAFSRRQVLAPRDLELNAVIDATTRMLRRLIGEDVSLGTIYHPNLGLVRADPGQMEQVLMNLAANARDAMPSGGTLTISTSQVTLMKADAARHPGGRLGAYAVLTVRDTGIGMDAATMARIFEPFFTTKGVGQGTGLGLAAVYGIVTQQGGFIDVESALGQGTTMNIYLPQIDRATNVQAVTSARPKLPRGVETILLVDDETRLRRVAQLVLEGSGYTVLEAENGDRALTIAATHEGRIDLILTDVVMPGMNGRVLVERLRPRLSGVKALFMSGYTDDVVLRNGVVDAEVSLLQKPFTPLALAQKVRQVLDAA